MLATVDHRSRLMDELFAPFIAFWKNEEAEWSLSSREKAILGSVFKDAYVLCEELAPLKERLAEYYPIYAGYGLGHVLYLYLLEQGHDPKTYEALLELMRGLDDQAIRQAMALVLLERDQELDQLEQVISQADIKADSKWYWFQTLRQPQKVVAEMVDLLEQVTVLYQPLKAKYAKEYEDFAQNFDLDQFLELQGQASVLEVIAQYRDKLKVYFLNPYHVRLSFLAETEDKTTASMVVSARMDQLLAAGEGLDLDKALVILKTLSDVSRYKVLQELAAGGAKSKHIAKQLGITGAAVSFHTQKLLNAQILLVNSGDDSLKYRVNKPLLQEVIAQLQEDFDLPR